MIKYIFYFLLTLVSLSQQSSPAWSTLFISQPKAAIQGKQDEEIGYCTNHEFLDNKLQEESEKDTKTALDEEWARQDLAMSDATPWRPYETYAWTESPIELGGGSMTKEQLQANLDVAGLAPGGIIADIINTGIYISDANWIGAAGSGVGAIPFLGTAVAGARLGSKVGDVAKIGDFTGTVGRTIKGFDNKGKFTEILLSDGGTTLWISEGAITLDDVIGAYVKRDPDKKIHILSGAHGRPDGEIISDVSLLRDDLDAFDNTVQIYDITNAPPNTVYKLLKSGETVVTAFCDGKPCLEKILKEVK